MHSLRSPVLLPGPLIYTAIRRAYVAIKLAESLYGPEEKALLRVIA